MIVEFGLAVGFDRDAGAVEVGLAPDGTKPDAISEGKCNALVAVPVVIG